MRIHGEPIDRPHVYQGAVTDNADSKQRGGEFHRHVLCGRAHHLWGGGGGERKCRPKYHPQRQKQTGNGKYCHQSHRSSAAEMNPLPSLSNTRKASRISSSESVSFIFRAIMVRNYGKSMVPLPVHSNCTLSQNDIHVLYTRSAPENS